MTLVDVTQTNPSQKDYIVYSHINKKNRKQYIGWTSHSIEKRWLNHLKCVENGSQTLFHNAIRKWGFSDDVWEHEILETFFTRDDAKAAERLWIARRNSYAYEAHGHGYNMTIGGDGAVGYIFSDEAKKKSSEAHKGLKKTREHCQRLSIANRGKKRSKETCLRIGLSKLGKGTKHSIESIQKIRLNQPNRRKVQQLSLNGLVLNVFQSISDAQRETGVPATNIVKCCKGLLKTAGKFRWIYLT